jgi:cellulose synthase/poly-beta-1,6-N-acetylglucosamine synthase-like glycosyltransferase
MKPPSASFRTETCVGCWWDFMRWSWSLSLNTEVCVAALQDGEPGNRTTESRVLIAIATWNGRELLATCLQAVRALEYPNYDISVVDNGSADGSAEYVREAFPGVHVIENARNRGFAAATNWAIRESSA